MSEEKVREFTPYASQALTLAREEADRLNHDFVGTEHLLLGLIKLGQGVAVNVFRVMSIDLEVVRMEVEKQVGIGPDQKTIGDVPYTPRVKKVLALAAKQANTLNCTCVGTEHLLLGLLYEGEGIAARILKNFGVDIERVRQEVLKELNPNLQKSREENKHQEPELPKTTNEPRTDEEIVELIFRDIVGDKVVADVLAGSKSIDTMREIIRRKPAQMVEVSMVCADKSVSVSISQNLVRLSVYCSSTKGLNVSQFGRLLFSLSED